MNAKELLSQAEIFDGYLAACQQDPSNQAARRLCSYTPWPDQSLGAAYQKYTKSPLVILDPSAEGGMPHTRAGSIICLPAYFPESKIMTTLQHEEIHVSQREFPDFWTDKLRMDGWEPVSSRSAEHEIPEAWLSLCRFNPDTFQSRWWAWRNYYIPLPLFTRTDKPDLHDIVVRWYDRTSGRVLSSPPTSFTRAYGNVPASHMEHPFELFAYKKS